jgi:hypothetical protein
MTLKELSQLYYLNREIETDKKRLAALRRRAQSPSSPELTGMPYNGSPSNQLEKSCAEIIDLEAVIKNKIAECRRERNRLEKYITVIPDSLTRQVFTLRFIEGLSWDECEARLGSGNSWKNLSNICYRYIEKCSRTNEDNEE